MTALPRRLLAALLVLLVPVVLAACGDDSEGGGGDATGGDDTRVVSTDQGDVTVPADPQRVVAADFYAAFTLVDLGVVPVGVVGDGYDDQPERYSEPLAGAESIGTFEELDYEAVLALEPDVIVRSIDTEADVYERLSDIAPTVVVSFQQRSLEEVTAELGAALNRDDEATDLLAEYEERTGQIAEEYADVLAATTFALVSPTGDGSWWLYGRSWTDLTVLTDAGAVLAPPADQQTEQTTTRPLEDIPVLDQAGVLLLDALWDNAELTGSRLWAGLPAVQAGHVYTITTGTSSIGNGLEVLDEFEVILDQLRAA